MKNIYKFCLSSILFVFATTGQAQQLKLAPVAGLNIASMKIENSAAQLSNRMSYHAGLYFEYDFAKLPEVSLQLDVLFSNKGALADADNSTIRFSTNYIDVPLLVVYKFDLQAPKLVFCAGPYIAYGIGGNITTDIKNSKTSSEVHKINWGDTPTSDLKPLDYGLRLSAGFMTARGLFFNFHYEAGLADISPEILSDAQGKIHNNVFGLTAGFMIGEPLTKHRRRR